MGIKLSGSEKNKIQKEVKKAFNTIIEGWESLDMDLAFKAFHNSPDFYMIGIDCSICDYQTYINNNINYFKECSSFKLTTFEEKIKFLDKDMAIYSWIYKAEATLKTGDRDIIEKACATLLFKKINKEWKVIYYHEAALLPVSTTNNT